MKKFITFILCLSLILPMFYQDSAKAYEITSDIEYLENGYYVKTTLLTETDMSSSISTNDETFYKTGTKTYTVYNSSDEALWFIAITATFKCTPKVSAILMSYSGSGGTYKSSWKVHDIVASNSGQIAICEGQGTHYFTFIKTETVYAKTDLRCNTYGLLV